MSQEDNDDILAQFASELDSESANNETDPLAAAAAGGDKAGGDEDVMAQWAEAMAEDEAGRGSATFGSAASGAGTNAEGGSLGAQATDAHFQDMTEIAKQPKDSKLKRELDFILDIPLDVSAELGRTRLLINELLQLGQGSVVELNKLAGEPLEVYVNGKLVARGEAVVINEKFGVRLTDIISPIERVKQLG